MNILCKCAQRRRKQFQTGVAKNETISISPRIEGRRVFLSIRSISRRGGGANENFCQDRNVAPKTGVAKPYPCHTTFQTGVASATPATPLPAPCPYVAHMSSHGATHAAHVGSYLLALRSHVKKTCNIGTTHMSHMWVTCGFNVIFP